MFWKGQKYRNQSKYYISKTSSSFAETSMRENSTWLNTSPYQCCVCVPSLNLTDWGHFNEYLHFAPSHTLNVGVITYNCIAGRPVTHRLIKLFNKEILWEFHFFFQHLLRCIKFRMKQYWLYRLSISNIHIFSRNHHCWSCSSFPFTFTWCSLFIGFIGCSL